MAPEVRRWLRAADRLSAAVRSGEIGVAEWQERIEALFDAVELPPLLRAIDFDGLTADLEYPFDRAATVDPSFGADQPRAFTPRVFALRRGTAIVPHGHHYMVSMHLVLGGELHLRHHDRLADEPDALILKPTIDRLARAGDHSSISSRRDNVHWLQARSAHAFTVDVIVARRAKPKTSGELRDYVDPDRGVPLDGDRIRVPRISADEAMRRYGSGEPISFSHPPATRRGN